MMLSCLAKEKRTFLNCSSPPTSTTGIEVGAGVKCGELMVDIDDIDDKKRYNGVFEFQSSAEHYLHNV